MPASRDEFREVYRDFTGEPAGRAFNSAMHMYASFGWEPGGDRNSDEYIDAELDGFHEFLSAFYPMDEPQTREWWEEQRQLFYDWLDENSGYSDYHAGDYLIDWALFRQWYSRM